MLKSECESLTCKLQELKFIFKENPHLKPKQTRQDTVALVTEPVMAPDEHFNRQEFLRFLETNQTPENATKSVPTLKGCLEFYKHTRKPLYNEKSRNSSSMLDRSAESLSNEPVRQKVFKPVLADRKSLFDVRTKEESRRERAIYNSQDPNDTSR